MPLATEGRGPVPAVRALASQIHPVFMLPPVAASLFGGLYGSSFSVRLAALHAVAVFCGLYTAHVKDGYVDFYGRGEDEAHPLTERGCRVALALSTAGFLAATVALAVLVNLPAALLTLPGWLIGFHHAPHLDMHPLTATVGYPTGIALALLGGYYVQTTTLTATMLALAAVFLVVLSGIKVIDDATDYDYDRSIGKRTVAVVLGPARARRVAYGLMLTGMAAVVVAALTLPGIPPSGGLAAVAFLGVALLARDAGPELATKLLIRGSYVFLAVLVAAVWLGPL
ncbi:UbiA family prenyltransferase [Halomicrobium sp. IBSBa]|uniref:UbiA family prenyltransferase n=1 Tax=Halomicrobium sp. IBSBa TaxID=2778916 RepID=UPI001ABF1B5B|nr:UbiA family prenyltransferase [Halomicrobium sp. IBSBa]MBO4246625.1 UbiA family prenyltransferase [Halomicrobium sp. IBSBa]